VRRVFSFACWRPSVIGRPSARAGQTFADPFSRWFQLRIEPNGDARLFIESAPSAPARRQTQRHRINQRD
jgi:hypothetical protein